MAVALFQFIAAAVIVKIEFMQNSELTEELQRTVDSSQPYTRILFPHKLIDFLCTGVVSHILQQSFQNQPPL